MVGMVGFCGSRVLPPTAEVSALVAGVLGSVVRLIPAGARVAEGEQRGVVQIPIRLSIRRGA